MSAFVMKASGVPVGNYKVRFAGAEPYTANSEKYGEGVMLKFAISDGEHIGSEATRICGAKFSPKSTLAKFALALKGSPIEPGESFDFADYVGVAGLLVVEATESGSTRAATFIKA